jgi:hypothetical protein
MYARVTRLDAPSDRDRAIRMVDQAIPEAERLPGFVGGYWLLDQGSGTMLAVTLWETEEAVAASDAAADEVRAEAAQALKVTPEAMSVERYEVIGQAGRPAQTSGRS